MEHHCHCKIKWVLFSLNGCIPLCVCVCVCACVCVCMCLSTNSYKYRFQCVGWVQCTVIQKIFISKIFRVIIIRCKKFCWPTFLQKFNSMHIIYYVKQKLCINLTQRTCSEVLAGHMQLEATNGGDRKGLLYEATLFVNTWEGAVGRHAYMLASMLLVRLLPKSSPLLCSPLQSSLETVDYATVVLLGL